MLQSGRERDGEGAGAGAGERDRKGGTLTYMIGALAEPATRENVDDNF